MYILKNIFSVDPSFIMEMSTKDQRNVEAK